MHDVTIRSGGTLTEAEAGDYIGKPPGTLKQWRYLDKGPAYVKVGRDVRYLKADLDAFLAANRIDPSSAP